MDPEYAKSFEEFDDIADKSPIEEEENNVEIKKKLTDEDLNQLM